jgi:opacity protein-like surface antigen
MRKSSLGILATLLLSSTAFAADVAPLVKAPPKVQVTTVVAVPCTNTYCVAPYFGVGIGESGGSFNVISTGVNGLASNNLNMLAEFGYDYWNGTTYLGVNLMGEYGVQSDGIVPGGGNSALWGAGQWAKLGYNVAAALGITAPTSGTPSLAGVVANSTPYLNVGVFERPWGVGFLSGAGVQGWLSNNWTIHVDYLFVDYNNANVNPNVKEQSESMVLGGVDYHFAL